MYRQPIIFVSFVWETSVYLYLTGNLEGLLPFLYTTINRRAKPFSPSRFTRLISSQFIIIARQTACLTLCFMTLLIVLLPIMYTCWCPLILNSILLSLKCSRLLQNHTSHLVFHSENTVLMITWSYTTPFPPTICLLSTMYICWHSR